MVEVLEAKLTGHDWGGGYFFISSAEFGVTECSSLGFSSWEVWVGTLNTPTPNSRATALDRS